MKGMYLLHYRKLFYKQSIKNMDKPLCKGCVYLAYNNSIPGHSKCLRFGKKNLISGDIEYSFAEINRSEYGECGVDAKYRRILPEIDI